MAGGLTFSAPLPSNFLSVLTAPSKLPVSAVTSSAWPWTVPVTIRIPLWESWSFFFFFPGRETAFLYGDGRGRGPAGSTRYPMITSFISWCPQRLVWWGPGLSKCRNKHSCCQVSKLFTTVPQIINLKKVHCDLYQLGLAPSPALPLRVTQDCLFVDSW